MPWQFQGKEESITNRHHFSEISGQLCRKSKGYIAASYYSHRQKWGAGTPNRISISARSRVLHTTWTTGCAALWLHPTGFLWPMKPLHCVFKWKVSAPCYCAGSSLSLWDSTWGSLKEVIALIVNSCNSAESHEKPKISKERGGWTQHSQIPSTLVGETYPGLLDYVCTSKLKPGRAQVWVISCGHPSHQLQITVLASMEDSSQHASLTHLI